MAAVWWTRLNECVSWRRTRWRKWVVHRVPCRRLMGLGVMRISISSSGVVLLVIDFFLQESWVTVNAGLITTSGLYYRYHNFWFFLICTCCVESVVLLSGEAEPRLSSFRTSEGDISSVPQLTWTAVKLFSLKRMFLAGEFYNLGNGPRRSHYALVKWFWWIGWLVLRKAVLCYSSIHRIAELPSLTFHGLWKRTRGHCTGYKRDFMILAQWRFLFTFFVGGVLVVQHLAYHRLCTHAFVGDCCFFF